jgi:hypothetical protein
MIEQLIIIELLLVSDKSDKRNQQQIYNFDVIELKWIAIVFFFSRIELSPDVASYYGNLAAACLMLKRYVFIVQQFSSIV